MFTILASRLRDRFFLSGYGTHERLIAQTKKELEQWTLGIFMLGVLVGMLIGFVIVPALAK